jgi:hypothetical protein
VYSTFEVGSAKAARESAKVGGTVKVTGKLQEEKGDIGISFGFLFE